MPDFQVTLPDIEAAAERIYAHTQPTPLIESPQLNAAAGGRVLLKLESLQRTGSFKFRGAMNKLSLIKAEARSDAVVAFSTGNHAQAVAAAAQLQNIPAIIAMPEDTPPFKVERTRSYGAEIVFFDRKTEDGTDVGKAIAAEKRASFVSPFNDHEIIAGQGTCALEILNQANQLGLDTVDNLYISSAGGGFITGCAIAAQAVSPTTQVRPVEAEGWDGIRRSLLSGSLQNNQDGPTTICDAILAVAPGEIPYSMFKDLLAPGVVVTDAEAMQAVAFAFTELKLILEPGGAAALAACLARKVELQDKVSAVALCSGNIAPKRLFQLLRDFGHLA